MASKLNIADFGTFFADGQKYETDIRGLVLCSNRHLLERVFVELSDLATVDRSGRAQLTITYRSGACLRFVNVEHDDSLDRVAGYTFTHLFVIGEIDKFAMTRARFLLRTSLPRLKVDKNVVYLDA